MLLSHLYKSSHHICIWGRKHKKIHMMRCHCLLYSKREEDMNEKQWPGVFSASVLPTPALGADSMVPTSILDLGLGCDVFILKKHSDQACSESRLQHLKVVSETKSTIRQQVPVFTEKILAYSSSVSLFYCHMRTMHSTYGLLRHLNC